jgi:L-alanine-DL-glutamate epimerase-like enolase superfamily enzyme
MNMSGRTDNTVIEIQQIRYFRLSIPFTASFSHGSAERGETETVIVEVTDSQGIVGHGEGCPRSYVSGEDIGSCQDFYRAHDASFKKVTSLETLQQFVQAKDTLIDDNPAAWCAVELALLDVLAKARNISVESLLGLSAGRYCYTYSAVLGDSSPESFASLYKQYREMGFSDYKIKLSNNLSQEKAKLQCLSEDLPEITLRADANNLWSSKEEAVRYINDLDIPFQSLEEPIEPNQYESLCHLADELKLKVILDESFMRFSQVGLLEGSPSSWIVNVRVSKMGGILRSLRIIGALTELGIEITIGAQVGETSLLTRAALILADEAGDSLCAQEGAFGTLLLTRDIFEPSLQFGDGGLLTDTVELRSRPGFGLALMAGLDSDPDVSELPVDPELA